MEIPKFLQRRTFDVLMYGYVDAIVSNFPSVGIRKAIKMFRSRYELDEDWSEETACSTYQRMKAELRIYDKERKSAT